MRLTKEQKKSLPKPFIKHLKWKRRQSFLHPILFLKQKISSLLEQQTPEEKTIIQGFYEKDTNFVTNDKGISIFYDQYDTIKYVTSGKQVTLPYSYIKIADIVHSNLIQIEHPLCWDAPHDSIQLSYQEIETLKEHIDNAMIIWRTYPIYSDFEPAPEAELKNPDFKLIPLRPKRS